MSRDQRAEAGDQPAAAPLGHQPAVVAEGERHRPPVGDDEHRGIARSPAASGQHNRRARRRRPRQVPRHGVGGRGRRPPSPGRVEAAGGDVRRAPRWPTAARARSTPSAARCAPTTVQGPLGDPVAAEWRMQGDGTAVVEMARASGLALVGGPAGNDPLRASTAGTGELIAAAIDAGARRVIVGAGGSASTDGGLGRPRPPSNPRRRLQPASSSRGLRRRHPLRRRRRGLRARRRGPRRPRSPSSRRRLERLAQIYVQRYGVDVTRPARLRAPPAASPAAWPPPAPCSCPGFDLVAEALSLAERIAAADLSSPARAPRRRVVRGQGGRRRGRPGGGRRRAGAGRRRRRRRRRGAGAAGRRSRSSRSSPGSAASGPGRTPPAACRGGRRTRLAVRRARVTYHGRHHPERSRDRAREAAATSRHRSSEATRCQCPER